MFFFFIQVHAFSVCDDPDYFYDYTQGLLDGLNAGVDSHDIVNIQNVSVYMTFKNILMNILMNGKQPTLPTTTQWVGFELQASWTIQEISTVEPANWFILLLGLFTLLIKFLFCQFKGSSQISFFKIIFYKNKT